MCWRLSRRGRCRGPHEPQIAHPEFSALDLGQAGFAQLWNYLAKVEVSVSVIALDQAALLLCGPCEIDDQQSPARLQNAAYLAQTLMASVVRQMMKHHGAQHDVESGVGKRHRFDDGGFEP
jgi:hypothetical protein